VSDGVAVRGLLETLAAEGEEEARLVVERARAEAARIAAESAARLGDELQKRKVYRAQELAASEGAARMEARKGKREKGRGTRERVVNRVIEVARGMLAGAATEEWTRAGVARVLEYMPDGKATVRCASRDLARVREAVASRANTTVVPDESISGGVIAEMADGSLMVDGTLESRLERMRTALAIEIVAALEGAP
jgi:vacuolar-type H+-ATPase subunit E/Vma4